MKRHLDIHKDDTVQVMVGKDRGKRGVVLRTVPATGKIVVKGLNMAKRHQRALTQKGATKVMPLNYSNVMLVCNKCDKPTRIRKTTLPTGQQAIVCVKCGEIYERVKEKV